LPPHEFSSLLSQFQLQSDLTQDEDAMPQITDSPFITSTAGEIAAELARRGVAPSQNLTIALEPADDWLAEARAFSRPKVIEAGWSDEDIDRLIKQAQKEVEPLLPR